MKIEANFILLELIYLIFLVIQLANGLSLDSQDYFLSDIFERRLYTCKIDPLNENCQHAKKDYLLKLRNEKPLYNMGLPSKTHSKQPVHKSIGQTTSTFYTNKPNRNLHCKTTTPILPSKPLEECKTTRTITQPPSMSIQCPKQDFDFIEENYKEYVKNILIQLNVTGNSDKVIENF